MGDDTWVRRKGELLRPDQYSSKVIKRVKQLVNPDFETFYQQNPGGGSSLRIKRKYIHVVTSKFPAAPDCAQRRPRSRIIFRSQQFQCDPEMGSFRTQSRLVGSIPRSLQIRRVVDGF